MIDLIVQVLRCPRITTPTQLVVALVIARRCGDDRGCCFAKQATLATDSRLHQKTVAKTIAELEGMGLIRKVKGRVLEDGRRTTDHLYLTLDAVVLPPTGPDDDGSPALPPGSPPLPGKESTTPSPGSPRLHKKRPDEETNEGEDARDSRELAEQDSEGVDLDSAVAVIWAGVGDNGRRRSAKAKVKKALSAALGRRPRGVDAEDHLKRILQGVRAYLAHPDTRKEGGRFEHGAHRTLENDVWESFLDDQPARAAAGERQAADPDLGSVDAPGPKLMRYWMETHGQGLPWHAERGPRPGMPGCRVSDEIQREFGVEPYAAPGDDDASAFL